jgi:hypothetical protein
MAFNGSGTFNRLYSWVQDAANGINIDATRSDNELNGFATGLSNCVTRDGQSPFLANIPAGGFKITGLGTPTSTGDAATYEFVNTTAANEWKLESNTVAYIGPTSFRVLGGDYTATYHVGRRVKIVNNTGATTSYGTIFTSVFPGTGGFLTDTVIGVALDAGASLVSTVTAVSYGLLSYTNPSYLDPRSVVLAVPTGNGVATNVAATKVSLGSEIIDSQSEFAASRFTALHPGYYLVSGGVSVIAASGGNAIAYVYKTGVAYCEIGKVLQSSAGFQFVPIPTTPVLLAKGDYLELFFQCSVAALIESTGTGSAPYDTTFAVTRLA